MRIGIDIDDTLVSSSESFDKVVKKYKLNFNKKLKDVWTEDERTYIYKNFLKEALLSARVKTNAKKVIDELNKLGHDLFILTARGNKHCKNIEEETLEVLKTKKINISKVYYCGPKKSSLAKELNLDLMIDDNINVYNEMIKENIKCLRFGIDVKNWDEVLAYINNMEE